MNNSLIIDILKAFTKDEMKDFEKFVNSPYFVNRKKAGELFEVLKGAYPKFSPGDVAKEGIFGKLFPDTKYDDASLRKVIAYLHSALKEYLAYRSFKENEFIYEKCLVEEGYRRGLDRLTQSCISRMEKLLNERPERNEEYYYYKYKLEEEKLLLSAGGDSKNWQTAFDDYCNYFLINLLRHYSVMSNDMKFYKMEYKLHFADEILSMLEGSRFLKVPAIAIYFYSISLYHNPENEDYFYKLKELLFKHGEELGKASEEGLYIYLQNYCYRKADTGDIKFLNERFYILEKIVKKELCIRDGYIVKDFFNSMVIVALELGKLSYADSFIKKYQTFLHIGQSSNVLSFNYACLEFYKKDYERALEYLSKVEYDDFYDKVIVRSLNLMIYYEAGMIEQGISLIDSFNHFLSSNKDVSPYVKDRTKNFIDIINRLFKIKEGNSKIDIKKLKKDVTDSDMLMRRMWLIEKVNEF